MPKTAKDPLHYAREIVGKDPMATYLGIKVEEVRKEYACGSGGYKGIALSFTINFTRGAVEGEKIAAEASPLFIGRKVSLWKIQVTGKGGTLIASCEGFAYHKD